MHRIIDWNELWKAIYASSPDRVEKGHDPAAHWNKRAAAYRRATRDEKRATEQELAILDLAAGETVLDVGAGTGGRLAVPIARTAAHVTALDPPSEGMLAVLREQMAAAGGRTNYSTITLRWEDTVIGRDVEPPHDVVVAAFSLGFYDLDAALEKLDAAARRVVYLFWHAGEWRDPDEMALYRAVFGEEATMRKGYPDYIYPVNILHDAGIYPNVRIYRAAWDAVYDSVEDAAGAWAAMHNPGMEDLSPVRDYFARVLRTTGSGKYVETTVRPTAAVWWEKVDG
ncbi:methyltransferase domain-containing protein [Methanoculleus chikugoensis]|uniref:class I SAM-dependent methyltransferase n=1 Tax=Methanoculleus chikugoensis TaxID=118126 RepID=UPI0006D101D8|nr:class I SAM-dependent methyltransferase [Methanoculleus chikugoensis]